MRVRSKTSLRVEYLEERRLLASTPHTLRDIAFGDGSSDPNALAQVGAVAFCTPDNRGSGREVAKSDGSQTGFVQVTDDAGEMFANWTGDSGLEPDRAIQEATEVPDLLSTMGLDHVSASADAGIRVTATNADPLILNYIPITLGGYVYFDVNNDGIRQENDELSLIGVEITLSGQDVFGQEMTPWTVMTDRSGHYSFTGLAPGIYCVREREPANMVDGMVTGSSHWVSVTGRNELGFRMTVEENVNAGSHVFDNNNFGERSLGSSFLGIHNLLFNNPEPTELAVFSFSDASGQTLDWHSIRGANWSSYSIKSFRLDYDFNSAVLQVSDQSNQTFQAVITVDSARLRIRLDSAGHAVVAIIGSFDDFSWSSIDIGGDLNQDLAVDAADAAVMFGGWGFAGPGDINHDGIVDAADAEIMFANWTGDLQVGKERERAVDAV